MSLSRYQQAQEAFESPRAAEHRMLARVTGMLRAAASSGGRERVEACYYNRKLWSIFQADLAAPENGLPDEVKARLISISLWVQKYTGEAMAGAPVEPLINVNRAIMEGLMPTAPAGEGAAQPAAPAPAGATTGISTRV
jgi:flagellar protein FlaF